MIYVVGSGPAGVSAAKALIRGGHRVTMLDAGLELEPERQAVVHQLANQEPGDWAPASIAKLKENYQASAAGIPLKYSYGSDFPYRETDRYLPNEAANVGLAPSLAKGGFSNVWGAAVLPYLASEFGEWPIRYEDLAPHYRSVLSFTGLAATPDDLKSLFPLHSDTAVSLHRADRPRLSWPILQTTANRFEPVVSVSASLDWRASPTAGAVPRANPVGYACTAALTDWFTTPLARWRS